MVLKQAELCRYLVKHLVGWEKMLCECLYLCQSIISPFFWLFWRKFHGMEGLECRDNRHCIRIESVVNIFHQFGHILDLYCACSFKNSLSNWNLRWQEMKSSTLSKIRLDARQGFVLFGNSLQTGYCDFTARLNLAEVYATLLKGSW